MWKMLEVTHQGTNSLKETKINIFVQQYEMLKMSNDENISQMFAKFSAITNDLNALGRTHGSTELVNKILRNLLKAYQGKVITHRVTHDS